MAPNPLLRTPTAGRRPWAVAAALALAVGLLGAWLFGGGAPAGRPDRPGGGLAAGLDALRGANDLVRAGRDEVGRDPALYPTAYGRLEAAVLARHGGRGPVPDIRPAALADLVRRDTMDTPAWQAHYVCLATAGSRTASAADVLRRAGLREAAEREALGYLRAPDPADDALTSLATRAAFLHTLACLDRADAVPPAALREVRRDAERSDRPVPVLYAVEALRAAGVEARPAGVLEDADSRLDSPCSAEEPIQRAALVVLRQRLTAGSRACLLRALDDPDTQTRWLVRRALAVGGGDGAAADSRAPHVRTDGLVPKSPAQLGTLTATYNAARALTAAGRQEQAPAWLVERLRQMGNDSALEPADRVPLAMICHRLSLSCGPQAAQGAREAREMTVPPRLTEANWRSWHGALTARAEFGLGCPRTSVALPDVKEDAKEGRLPRRVLETVVALGDVRCDGQAREVAAGVDLVAQARGALRDGDLVTGSAALQAALAAGQPVPPAFWDEAPALLDTFRDARHPDLFAPSPGAEATAEATRAAYYLLA